MKIEDHHAAIRSDINLLRDTLKLGEDNKTAHKTIDGVLNLVDGFLCDIAVIARAHEPDIRLAEEPQITDEEYNSTRDWFYTVTQSDDYPSPPGPLYDLAQRMLDTARTDQHALKNLMLEAFGTVVRALVSADITNTLASDVPRRNEAEAPELTEDTVQAAFANKTERAMGQTPQHKLAKELKELCCAETEGKFFNTVAENIDKITEALNAQGDMKDYMAQIAGAYDRHRLSRYIANPELLKQAGLQITQNEQGHWIISKIEIQPGDGSLMAQHKPGTHAFQSPIAPPEPEAPLTQTNPCANPECKADQTYYNPLASLCPECTKAQTPVMTICPQCGQSKEHQPILCSIATCPMH